HASSGLASQTAKLSACEIQTTWTGSRVTLRRVPSTELLQPLSRDSKTRVCAPARIPEKWAFRGGRATRRLNRGGGAGASSTSYFRGASRSVPPCSGSVDAMLSLTRFPRRVRPFARNFGAPSGAPLAPADCWPSQLLAASGPAAESGAVAAAGWIGAGGGVGA